MSIPPYALIALLYLNFALAFSSNWQGYSFGLNHLFFKLIQQRVVTASLLRELTMTLPIIRPDSGY